MQRECGSALEVRAVERVADLDAFIHAKLFSLAMDCTCPRELRHETRRARRLDGVIALRPPRTVVANPTTGKLD